MMRARQALKNHRFSDAEPLLHVALERPGRDRQGGERDACESVQASGPIRRGPSATSARAGAATTRWGRIQELVRLDTTKPIPIEQARPILQTAARAAPDDDRIWLGWASLATRQGHFEEARRWLDRCLGRRPDDPVVWRARLDWARAAEIESEVRRAPGASPARPRPADRGARPPRLVRSPGRRHGTGATRAGGADRARPGAPAGDGEAGGIAAPHRPAREGQAAPRATRRAGADAGLVHGQDLPRRPARPCRGAGPGRRGDRPAVRGPLLVGARRRAVPRGRPGPGRSSPGSTGRRGPPGHCPRT